MKFFLRFCALIMVMTLIIATMLPMSASAVSVVLEPHPDEVNSIVDETVSLPAEPVDKSNSQDASNDIFRLIELVGNDNIAGIAITCIVCAAIVFAICCALMALTACCIGPHVFSTVGLVIAGLFNLANLKILSKNKSSNSPSTSKSAED